MSNYFGTTNCRNFPFKLKTGFIIDPNLSKKLNKQQSIAIIIEGPRSDGGVRGLG